MLHFLKENDIPIHEDLENPGIKVLVVDDEKAIISVIRRYLESIKTPFQIEVATDGFDVGRLTASFRPSVVFLDLRLPGIDGFEVCRRIKHHPLTESTQVIAMTGYYQGETAERVLEYGASLLIAKPFTTDDLKNALEKAGIKVD